MLPKMVTKSYQNGNMLPKMVTCYQEIYQMATKWQYVTKNGNKMSTYYQKW